MRVKDFPRIKTLLNEIEACEQVIATRTLRLGGHNSEVNASDTSDTARHRSLHAAINAALRAYRKEVIAELQALDAPITEEEPSNKKG